MRVADSSIYQAAARNAGNARSRFVGASNRLSTGYRITHPSEDPVASARANAQQTEVARLQTIAENLGRANGEVALADTTLGSVADLLTRAKELAIQLANDTYSANDRAGAATEVAGLVQSMTAALNQSYGDRYLFAGTATDVPPFDIAGNFVGNEGERSIEVAPGVVEAVNVNAAAAVKGTAGGVDVYTVLADLQAALNADSATAIRATLSGLDSSIEQVTLARVEAGNKTRVFEAAEAASIKLADHGTVEISHLLEQDLVEGSTALAEAENALNAVLTASAKTFKLSILDRL